MTKIGLKSALLVLLNCCLLAFTVFVWRNGQYNIHQSEQTSAHALAMPDLAALNAKPAISIDIAAIREDAVFHNRRIFYRPPSPPQVISTPEYELAGTMGLPQGKRLAFVRKNADQTNRTLHVGDDLDGWRVETIDVARVIVAREDQRYELKTNTTSTSPVLGLVRGEVAPRIVQSGARVLGAQKAETFSLPQDRVATVRRYRPPPPQ